MLLKAVAIKPGFKAARLKLATIGKPVPMPKATPMSKRIQVASLDPTTIPQTLVTGSLRTGQSDLIIQKTDLPKAVSVPKKMHKAEIITKMPPLPQVPALPKTANVSIKIPAPVSVAAISKSKKLAEKTKANEPQNVLVKAKISQSQSRMQGWTVQISSQRNSDAAWDVWKNLQAKYSNLLRNKEPFVAKADLGTRGIFYRLRVHKLNSKKAAARLCGQLKRKGTGCFVSKA